MYIGVYLCVMCIHMGMCVRVLSPLLRSCALHTLSYLSSRQLFPTEPVPSFLGRWTELWTSLPGPRVALWPSLVSQPSVSTAAAVCGTDPRHFSTTMPVDWPWLCHPSAKNPQCPRIRMKPRFLSPKGLLWFSFCPPLAIPCRGILLQTPPDPCWTRLYSVPFVFFPVCSLLQWVSPFFHLSNSWLPFNTLPNIMPPRNLPQHPTLTERAPLVAQWSCLPLDRGLLGGDTYSLSCISRSSSMPAHPQRFLGEGWMDGWMHDSSLLTSGIVSGLDIRSLSLGGEDIKSLSYFFFTSLTRLIAPGGQGWLCSS